MDSGLSHILVLGLLMATGLTAGVLVSRFGLPLGIIAYLIGGSITIPQMRRMGTIIFSSALGGAIGAVLIVVAAIFPFAPEIGESGPLMFTLALGAIASTTAPAATIAVLHQYRARGPLSSTLLGVVAVDDIIGIIIFSLMLMLTTGASLALSYEAALIEIFGSLLLGGILGLLLAIAGRHVRQGGLRLPIILASIFLAMGLSEFWHLSPLLTAMMLGFTARWRLRAAGDRLFAPVDYFEEMVFVIFFTIAGTHFDLHVFYSYFGLILIYFLARFLGKVIGTYVGASLTKAPKQVRYWQGLALTPQAGVAVGLALTLLHQPGFEEIGGILINIVVAATILNEFFGPLAIRFALFKAGEIDIETKRRKVKS
jgi:Kef-type K+ transport system membrane component KefB